jgi:ABC-type polar amino acid transport system ATPase subunit
MTALEVRGLEVRRNGRPLVRGVSFAAARGDVVALMGPSGAGKTTVLRAVAGLEPIAAGLVAIDGLTVGAGSIRRGAAAGEIYRRVGMVFQFHHLFAHMSAARNVWLAPVHVLGQPQAEAERRGRALLEQLGVGHRADALPHELSGGEAQRVAIARALAMDPPVLLLDEPTAALDPARRSDLAGTLAGLAQAGRTLVVATHDAEFARACARRIVVLDEGRVIREAHPAELLP